MSLLTFPDQGVVRRHALVQDQPQTHTVTAGETLNALANRYGVQPQAIREANPQIYANLDPMRREHAQLNNGDVLFGGDVLAIPAAVMSVTEAPIDTGSINPNMPSPGSEVRVGDVTYNPGDGSVKLTTQQRYELGAMDYHDPSGLGPARQQGIGRTGGIGIEIVSKQEVSGGRTIKDGKVEYTLEAVAESAVAGEAQLGGKRGGLAEASLAGGVGLRYKVVLPPQHASVERALAIDPDDPGSLPDGATITLDSRSFGKTVYAGAFMHVGIHGERLDGNGATISITRQGNSVSVLAGPTQTIETFAGNGVFVGDVRAIAGRQDLLGSATLHVATFDLGNPDAQAAYQHFLLTGQVAHATPGVSGVAEIGRVDLSSQSRLRVDAGPIGIDLAGGLSTGSYVRADFPDGSFTQTWEFKQDSMAGSVPLQITSRFDAQGNELLSERTYAYTIDTTTPGTAESLNLALSGGAGGSVLAGDKVTLVFDEGQMQQLLTDTRTARNAHEVPSAGRHLDILLNQDAPHGGESASFAVRMAGTLGSDPYAFATRLVDVARGADGDLDAGALKPVDAMVRW